MKIRNGFVSNSSSSSFLITNKTNEVKRLVDFVNENPQLVEIFNIRYGYNYTQKEMIKEAEKNSTFWFSGESMDLSFGDEDGTIIGHVFDYVLGDDGESESFKWKITSCRGETY